MFENIDYTSNLVELDKQHEDFFESLVELKNCISNNKEKDQILILIDKVSRYSKEHFDFEEKIAELIDFPRIQELKDSHADFRETYKVIERVYSPNKETICRVYALHLVDLLYNWTISHIDYVDMDLIEHVKVALEKGIITPTTT